MPEEATTPNPLNASIRQLTIAIGQLNEHVRNADEAAKQRALQTTNDARVRQFSAGQAQAYTGQGTPTAGAIATTSSTAEKLAAGENQRAQQRAQERADSRTNVGGSMPPNARNIETSDTQESRDLLSGRRGEAMTMATLGERGGPFGEMAVRQYALERNLNWGANVAGIAGEGPLGQIPGLSGALGGVDPNTGQPTGGLAGGLNKLAGNKQLTYGVAAGVGAINTIKGVSTKIDDLRNAGFALGYGGPNSAGTGFLGVNNPFAQTGATGEGASLYMTQLAASGRLPGSSYAPFGRGLGLTSGAARSAVDVLAGQGFSNQSTNPLNFASGDTSVILKNMMAPLMNQWGPNFSQDIAQWTPALRQAGTSVQQLTGILQQVPDAARSAKETVDQYNAGLLETANLSESQGGTKQLGAETGLAFTQATGMPSQFADPLMQSGLYKAQMMGQYGVLPSGIPNLPGGAQAQGMMSMLQRLQGMTGGMFHDIKDPLTGLPMETAQTQQNAFIGQLTGVPTQQINAFMQQMPQEQATTFLQTHLGSQANQSGIYSILGAQPQAGQEQQAWAKLSPEQQQQASSTFQKVVTPQVLGQALANDPNKQKDINWINSTDNSYNQMRRLSLSLDAANQNSPFNKLQQDASGGQNTAQLSVQFTGQAQKLFQQDKNGNNWLKLAQNAGQSGPTNSALNGPLGDLLHNPAGAGLNAIPSGLSAIPGLGHFLQNIAP